jgi:hypothetical protein
VNFVFLSRIKSPLQAARVDQRLYIEGLPRPWYDYCWFVPLLYYLCSDGGAGVVELGSLVAVGRGYGPRRLGWRRAFGSDIVRRRLMGKVADTYVKGHSESIAKPLIMDQYKSLIKQHFL